MLIKSHSVLDLYMRRPIKHILDDTVTDEAGAAVRTVNIVQGVTNADPYNVAQSQVNGGSAVITKLVIMLEFAINVGIVNTGLLDRLDWYLWFNVAGAQTAPDPRTAGQSDLKNQIFHMDQALLGGPTAINSAEQQATKAFATWHLVVNVPKWAQKINKDDTIELKYVHSDSAANKWLKMKVIFMEYEQA